MMDPEAIARELLKYALTWEPHVMLIGNVMASEVAALAARTLMTCPACGSEAWVNIDCATCHVVGLLLEGKMR